MSINYCLQYSTDRGRQALVVPVRIWLGSTDEAPSTAKNAAQAGRARNQVRGARKARRQSLARAWHYLRVAMGRSTGLGWTGLGWAGFGIY